MSVIEGPLWKPSKALNAFCLSGVQSHSLICPSGPATESSQHSLEGKVDEVLTVMKVIHCNVETVASFAKDVRESLGGPPLSNLPPLEPQEEDEVEESDGEQD